MPQTPNHGYNVPNKGEPNWHQPLNENFEQYERDIEIRDELQNLGNYEPHDGAKFFATDLGAVLVGNGTGWVEVESTGSQPALTAINADGDRDLGVGTAVPESKLHVTDDPATTGSTDLSRNVAVVENTSGDAAGDVLGLKTRVTDPGERTDYLSFLDGSKQIGQVQGNGAGGLTLQANNRLDLGANDNSVASVHGDDRRVEIGDVDGDDSTPKLHLKHSKSDWSDTTLKLEGGDTYAPRIDLIARGDPFVSIHEGGGGRDLIVTPHRGDFVVSGDIRATGSVKASSKNFVQSVDTPEGERDVVYTSTEAPTPRTEISGVAELEDGRAEIELPDHFGWVTDAEVPLHVQTTPYCADSGGLAVVERSTDRLVVEDREGKGDYEFSYTVRGTREGYADTEVVPEPADEATDTATAPADD